MSDLVPLLEKALYIYRREPEALHVMLDSPTWIDTFEMNECEIDERISASEHKKRIEVMKKALIEAPNIERPEPRPTITWDELAQSSATERERGDTAQRQIEAEDALLSHQANRSTEEYIVSHLLSRASQLSKSVDLIQSEVGTYVPTKLRNLVRDCHVAVADQNYVLAAILVGTSLECCLRDLINDNEITGLSDLIEAAKDETLVTASEDVARLDLIKRVRNKAVHEGLALEQRVHEAFIAFRDLIPVLYEDREELL